MKKCSKCNQDKELSEFVKDRTRKDGLKSQCKTCQYETTKKWREQNPEKAKQSTSNWRSKNRDRMNKTQRAYRNKNKDYINARDYLNKKKSQLRRKYNLTLEQAEEIYSRGCEICGSIEKLRIDHCHESSKIRGCLCDQCNTSLGYYEKFKREDLITKFEAYLEETAKS